ncbi:MAG: SPFH domain-containing protein [Planctomycetota bacterium]
MNTHRSTSETSRNTGIVAASAACLLVAAVAATGYAWWHGNYLLGGLGLQLMLATSTVLSVWHSLRIRGRFAMAWGPSESLRTEVAERLSSRWGDEEEYEPDAEHLRQDLLEDATHDRNVHFLFLQVGAALLIGAIATSVLFKIRAAETPEVGMRSLVFGLICLAASCVWIVLSRSYAALSESDLPGARKLSMVLREAQWATLLGAAALLGSFLWAPLETWLARVLLAWLVAVCVEQLIRSVLIWRKRPVEGDDPVPPYSLALRESLLVHGNPLTSLLESFERRFGVSFRSSWTIRFIRRAFVPILVLSGLLYWALTSLTLVGPSELGIRESFGQFAGKLEPGLHLKWPWPFGKVRRFEVKRIHVASMGAEESEEDHGRHRPRAILWTEAHAHGEFALVLGTGTDAVSVDALVYYKIREDMEGLLDYAYHTQNPVAALQGFGMRCLMEHTRSATLEEVLSVDRARYSARLKRDLRQYVADNRLGIDVVDLALINLHPPTDAAAAYLDVISAETDKIRYQVEAEGEKQARIQEAEKTSGELVANAKAKAARRVGEAIEESAQFVAMGEAFESSPEAFRLRMSGDVISEVIGSKPLTLVDPGFIKGHNEMMLDLRPPQSRTDAAETR